jgi:uncharacterized protein YbbC (DUF1343 family)
MSSTITGLERLIASPPSWIKKQRLGLLCNPASVDRSLRHARDLIHEALPGQLKALFSPQHGFFAEKQDNMQESVNATDPVLKIPVYSLYSHTRIPTPQMLKGIDTLIIDLQDVGTRVYTFIYTVSYCLEAAKREGIKVLLLDRPNPINGAQIEGNCLNPKWASFVGRYPIPMRHGMTVGELVHLFNDAFGIGGELEIMELVGWHRKMFFNDTELPWIPPSPNVPTAAAALVYPGQVLWEGTNVSEGRGTTQPFELWGAPFIDPAWILDVLGGNQLDGIILRPTAFEPTANKWQGNLCRGFQIHVIEPSRFKPYRTSLKLLQAVIQCHGKQFEWKSPPYEYEYEKLPIDLIIGDQQVRQAIEQQTPIKEIEAAWEPELKKFQQIREGYLRY